MSRTRLGLIARVQIATAALLAAVASMLVVAPAPPAIAASLAGSVPPFGPIAVTTQDDELVVDGDCSLREAVKAATSGVTFDQCPGDTDKIVLPSGTWNLATAIPVTGPIVITGVGRVEDFTGISSSIGGFGGPNGALVAPHLFDIAPGGALTLQKLTLQAAVGEMISAVQGARTVTLDGIETYDGVGNSQAVVTVDSDAIIRNSFTFHYTTPVMSTQSGKLSVIDTTASTSAACALCATSGTIEVVHSVTTALRTTSGPISVDRAHVTNSSFGPGSTVAAISSDSGAATVVNSSIGYVGTPGAMRVGGGTSTIRSSTLRTLSTAGPAVTATGSASVTATNSILSCSSATGLHSGGHNITDGSCGFNGAGDQVGDPLVAMTTIGPARNNSMQIDVGFKPALGSIAIDRGGNCEAVDQRGFSRPVDGNRDLTSTCDVGAVEIRPARALVGDWDGNGTDTPAEVVGNTFFLSNTYSRTGLSLIAKLGNGSGTPVVGDWNGDGIDTIGMVQGDVWFLSNSNTAPKADLTVKFAVGTGTPVVGDWNGDGLDTVGVVKGNVWSIRNSNTTGAPDATFTFGSATSTPVVGDWNGDGTDGPGAVDGKTWRIVDGLGTGPVSTFSYGAPGPVVAGDWDGDGKDGPGRVPSGSVALTWQLRNQPTSGVADLAFSYGNLATS